MMTFKSKDSSLKIDKTGKSVDVCKLTSLTYYFATFLILIALDAVHVLYIRP